MSYQQEIAGGYFLLAHPKDTEQNAAYSNAVTSSSDPNKTWA